MLDSEGFRERDVVTLGVGERLLRGEGDAELEEERDIEGSGLHDDVSERAVGVTPDVSEAPMLVDAEGDTRALDDTLTVALGEREGEAQELSELAGVEDGAADSDDAALHETEAERTVGDGSTENESSGVSENTGELLATAVPTGDGLEVRMLSGVAAPITLSEALGVGASARVPRALAEPVREARDDDESDALAEVLRELEFDRFADALALTDGVKDREDLGDALGLGDDEEKVDTVCDCPNEGDCDDVAIGISQTTRTMRLFSVSATTRLM